MKFTKLAAMTLASALAAVTLTVSAQVMVGGAAMYATKDIVDNAVNSKDHTTLVAAVKAAGLVDTLVGPGPVHRVRADQRRVRHSCRPAPSTRCSSPRTRPR